MQCLEKPDKKCVSVQRKGLWQPFELTKTLNWVTTFEILVQVGKKFCFYTWVPRETELIGRHGWVWKNWAACLAS